jgi:hypothetical protein
VASTELAGYATLYMGGKGTGSRKGSYVATSAEKPKSAMATLVESFEDLVESQCKKLSKEEFKKAEQNFERIVSKARASRARRRETA